MSSGNAWTDWKKVRPGMLGKTKLTGVPTSTSVKQHDICSDPISVDPVLSKAQRGSGIGGKGSQNEARVLRTTPSREKEGL